MTYSYKIVIGKFCTRGDSLSEPKKEKDYLGIGLGLGVALGVSLGLLSNNLGFGIAIGISLGVVYGTTMNAKNKKK
jgi:hypothetical protein